MLPARATLARIVVQGITITIVNFDRKTFIVKATGQKGL
jgi:hypothetical protein